jgi:hypothetical protein
LRWSEVTNSRSGSCPQTRLCILENLRENRKGLGKQRVVRERDQANIDHDSNTLARVKMEIHGLMAGLGDDHSLDWKLSCGPRASMRIDWRELGEGAGNGWTDNAAE